MMSDHNKQNFRPIVGIDLGTTNSAVACIRNGQPQLVASPKGEKIIPSVVLIDPRGKVVVGEDARAGLVAMPERSIAAVKRSMGSTERIDIAGESLLPQEISALILKELKGYADELYGEGEKEAVITVPAYFTDEQRRATKEAGELAGFVVERIINEPTAAALAFGLRHLDEDKHILVYDLGGGTFDVSVVEMMGGILEVKASAGNRQLGGEDFDWRLVDWLAERMIRNTGVDPRNDIRAKALLKEKAEDVKKLLSSEESTYLELPLVTVKDNRPVGLSEQITREQFVELIGDLLEETMECVRNVLKDAGLQPRDIQDVLLVGGSTRIPYVQELVRGLFGKAPRSDIHPDEAVALGAAVQAGLKSGALSDSGLIATDVAPFSMGIAVLKDWQDGTKPGGFAAIIPRNTTIPVTRTQTFYTSAPGQTAVSIEIYQGEHEWVKHNHRLGEFLMEGIPQNKKSTEAVDVTFRYNLNGILEVTSTCVTTGEAMSVSVQDALKRDSREAYEESLGKLETLWSQTGEALDETEAVDWDLENMDWDNEEFDLLGEDEDLDEDDESLETLGGQLHEQASMLRERAQKLLEQKDSDELRSALQSLDSAVSSEDDDQLQEAIDQVTDLLIDLEL